MSTTTNFYPSPGAYLFSLAELDRTLAGYLMDKDGNVYSTKHGPAPTRLHGTSTHSGRYYTLNKRTWKAADLVRRANAHPLFFKTPSAAPVHATVAGLPAGRTKSAKAAASVKGYLLASIGPTDKLVFGTDPVFHLSDTTAKAEAERIAGESGKEVVLLQVVGKVKVQKAVWE